jgi:hypothetical protein
VADRSVTDEEPGRLLGPAGVSDSASDSGDSAAFADFADFADFAPEGSVDTRASFVDRLVDGLRSALVGSAGPAETLASASPEGLFELASVLLEALDDAPLSESESPVSAAATPAPLAIATPTPAAIANPLTLATYFTRSIDRIPSAQRM